MALNLNTNYILKKTAYKNSCSAAAGAIYATGLGRMIFWGATAPVTGDFPAPGSLWMDTSNKVLRFNAGTLATPSWSTAGTGGSQSLDGVFDIGKVIDGATSQANAMRVGDDTDYGGLWAAKASNAFHLEGNTGTTIELDPDAASGIGTVNVNGVLVVDSTLTSTGDFAVGANKFNVTAATGALQADSTGNFDGDFTVNTTSFTVAATTGNTAVLGDFAVNTTALAVTAATGDVSVGNDLAVTGDITGTFTGTWGSTTWNANPTITLSATTGKGLTVAGTTVTSGDILYMTADASLSGNYIVCYDSSVGGGTNQFTVADLGVTTIRGPGIGSDALNLSTGDIVVTDGNVDITSASAAAGDLLDITRGNSATNGHAIDINMGKATVAGNAVDIAWGGAGTGDALAINMTNNVAGGALVVTGAGTRTDALIDLTDVPTTSAPTIGISATTQHNSGHVVDIDLAAGTHSCDVIHLTTTGAFTGDMINVLMTNAGVGAQAFVAASVANHTSPLVQLTSAGSAGGNAISIGSTATNGTGHVISITESGTSTNSLIDLNYAGAHTGDGININMANAAATANALVITSNVAQTVAMVELTSVGADGGNVIEIASTAAHAGADCISITESGTVANQLINLAYGAASTGDAINVLMTNAAVSAQALVVTSGVAATSPTASFTTANGAAATLYISNASTDAAGDAISILQHAAGANAALYVAYDAASTGDAIEVLMNGAATTSQALTITSNVAATVSPIVVADTGFVGASEVGLVNISATGALADAAASCLRIAYSGTGAASGLGTSIRVVDTGATSTSYAVSIDAATGESLIVNSGKSRFDETVTLKAAGLTAGNRFFGVPNHVTCGGGANDITVALLDGDGVAVTLAEGLELWIDMGATTLQAGANNINLNTAGNVRIYKSSNPTVDKAVAAAANSIVHVVYNGTSWLDMSE